MLTGLICTELVSIYPLLLLPPPVTRLSDTTRLKYNVGLCYCAYAS